MQGNCTKPKPDELELENLHRKGAKALRTQRQAKKTKNYWIAFDFLCENFASFAPLRWTLHFDAIALDCGDGRSAGRFDVAHHVSEDDVLAVD